MTNQVACAASAAPATVSDAVSQQVDKGCEFMQQAMTWFSQNGASFATKLVFAILILLVGAILIKCVTAAVRGSLRKTKRVNELLEKFICNAVSKTCWALLIVIVLEQLGIDMKPIIAGLGVTGFVLGFACQESLSNFASGIMIALNHPFKVGDYVIAGGVEGSVRELNMMAVVMTTPDNKLMTVPNKAVWGSAITNFSAMETRRVDVAVSVAYGSDIGEAKKIALEALNKIQGIIDDPPPMAEVAKLDDSAVVLTVRCWCNNKDYWTVYFAATRNIEETFAEKGVRIPFPQLDVHVHNA